MYGSNCIKKDIEGNKTSIDKYLSVLFFFLVTPPPTKLKNIVTGTAYISQAERTKRKLDFYFEH